MATTAACAVGRSRRLGGATVPRLPCCAAFPNCPRPRHLDGSLPLPSRRPTMPPAAASPFCPETAVACCWLVTWAMASEGCQATAALWRDPAPRLSSRPASHSRIWRHLMETSELTPREGRLLIFCGLWPKTQAGASKLKLPGGGGPHHLRDSGRLPQRSHGGQLMHGSTRSSAGATSWPAAGNDQKSRWKRPSPMAPAGHHYPPLLIPTLSPCKNSRPRRTSRQTSEIELNTGRPTPDPGGGQYRRPSIQVGSHYHSTETSAALSFRLP